MIKVIVIINFVLTLSLIGVLSWFIVSQNKTPKIIDVSSKEESAQYVDNCGENCKKIIEETVSKSLSTVSDIPKEETKTIISITPAPTKTKTQTSYIPIIGPITTTSSSWYDAPGTDFYLNIGDYGSKPYSTWEASLKVAHGNGTAYARLFDVTHGIAVNGSEITLTNNPSLTQVYSGSLNFWSANNLYRVQLKSLNTFEVTFGSGRVKIVY